MARLLAKIMVWVLVCCIAWVIGLAWFIGQIPSQPNRDDVHADAIVVLTGSSGRLGNGLRLLSEAKGNALFISGTGKSTTVKDIIHQAPPDIRETLQQMDPLPIFLGHNARNTIGNAEETALWIDEHHYKSILLVTANYHIPRSFNEFQELMPEITIIPEPVFSDDFNLNTWWADADSRAIVLSEYHKYIAGELRHWFVSVAQTS